MCSEKLYGPKESASPSELDLAEFCQPICTAVQIALVELLTTWGIKPLIVVGHSSGEVAAAYCAGIISKLHALRVAFLKGVAVAAASQIKPQDGAMLAVRLSLEKCQESISRLETDQGVESDALQIACHNSPQSVTVSGSKCGIDQLRALLGAEGVMAKVLNVGIAYHNSQHMHETAQLYQSLLEESLSEDDVTKTPATLKCCFVSSYDGKEFEAGSIATEHFNIDYWINNLVSPVRFTKAVENIAFLRDRGEAISDTYFLEVGPHNTLKSAIREIVPKEWSLEQGYSSLLSRNQPARRTAMTVAGKLHCLGYPVNLTQVNQISSDSNGVYKCLNDLPQYPFDHSKKHWLESRTSINHRFRKVPHNDFLGLRSLEWNPFEPEWNNRITLQEAVFVKDHKVRRVLQG